MKPSHLLRISAMACAAIALPCIAPGVDITNYTKPVAVDSQEKKSNYADAEYELAKVYLKGQGGPANHQKAFNLMKSAADQGHPEALGAIGFFYATGLVVEKNDAEAVVWFRKGAEAGGAKAQLNLGQMLARGLGVPKDEKEGLSWIAKSADQNLPDAIYALGSVYYFGKYNQPVDFKQALPHLLKVAELGNPDAQNMVGVIYQGVDGVKSDQAKAEGWFRKAAEQGNAKGQSNLGSALDAGGAGSAKRVEALKWLFLAKDQNEITADKVLVEVLPQAKQSEIDEARKLADEFQKSHPATAPN